MKREILTGTALATVLSAAALVAGPALAQDESQTELSQKIEQLEDQIAALKAQVDEQSEAPAMKPVAYGGRTADTMWHLAGYATTGLGISNGDEADSFLAGKFSAGFHFQYKDLVMFEGEVEFESEENETAVELEYSQIDIMLHDNMTLVIGKYLSPIGQYRERLHPDWINRAANAPAGFGHDGAQPASDVGVQLRGGVPLGDMKATYVLAMGNGPRMNDELGVELEGYGEDDNNNKSFAGRIGLFPLPSLEIGASYMTAKVDGIEGTGLLLPTRADFSLWGFDGAFTKGDWDVRFEYVDSKRDPINTAAEPGDIVQALVQQDLKAWYGQVAYRLSKVSSNAFLQRLEPVVRYGQFRAEGNEELEEMAQDNYYFGLNYWLAPSFVLRGAYEVRDFEEPGAPSEKIFHLQASYGF